ncbi:MAG: cysteine hydrolase [Bacillota bacterium]|nr:cysteine hydrolase [Bacillota bacterium]
MNWKKTALVVIDMENAFIDPASPLCIKNALATVPACGRVICAARERKMPVFFVNRVYRKNGSDVEFTRYQSWFDGGRYLAPGSKGVLSIEVPQEFQPKDGDYTIIKPRFSAFFQTELDLILRRLGVHTVFLAGTTTPNCIRTTCYDGISLDYNIAVIEDCCSSNTEEIQRVNMEDMERIGAVILSAETFLAADFAGTDLAGEIRQRVQADETAPE